MTLNNNFIKMASLIRGFKIGFIFIGLLATQVKAQPSLPVWEDSIRNISKQVLGGNDDRIRLSNSNLLSKVLTKALSSPDAFNYPFDSLKSISHIYAPDQSFRIFTWSIPKLDGSYEFGGLVEVPAEGRKPSRLIVLNDQSGDMENAETATLDPEHWFGALYYQILQNENGTTTYYTLLGWNGHDMYSRKKVIDILIFKSNGKIQFGAPVFSRFDRKVKRVIFEYSANSSMTLKYNREKLHLRVPGSNQYKPKTREVEKEMIVFDRLGPMNPTLEGQYQFYTPETNIFDAFVFEDGRWNFYKDVDARNINKPSKVKRQKPRLQLFPDEEEEKK